LHGSLVSKTNLKDQTRSFSAASQILSTFASDKPLIPVRFCKTIHKLEQSPNVQSIEQMKADMQLQVPQTRYQCKYCAIKNSDRQNKELGTVGCKAQNLLSMHH
jgi:hypothetical protein